MRIGIFQRRQAAIDPSKLVWAKVRRQNESADVVTGDLETEAPPQDNAASLPVEEPTSTALPPAAAAAEAPLPDTVTPPTDTNPPSSTEALPLAAEDPLPIETPISTESLPTETLPLVETAQIDPPAVQTPVPVEENVIEPLQLSAATALLPTETLPLVETAQIDPPAVQTPVPVEENVIEPLPLPSNAILPPTETASSTVVSKTATPSISVPDASTPPPAITDQTTRSAEATAPSRLPVVAPSSAPVDAPTPAPPSPARPSGAPSPESSPTISLSSVPEVPAAGVASSTSASSSTLPASAPSNTSPSAPANVAVPGGAGSASSSNTISQASTFLTVTSSAAKSTSDPPSFQRLSAVTSFTQEADTLPTAGVANLGSGDTGTNAGTLSGGTDVDGNPLYPTGISQDSNKVEASKTTVVISAVAIGVGSIALFIGIVFLIRRIMRKRRIGKAESPPSSPLLTSIDSPMPLSIARSMSQRSGGNDFWGFSNGNTIAGPRDEKNDSYRGVAPLSPLPPAVTMNYGNTNDFAGFKLFPSPAKGDGKPQTPRDF